VIAFLKLNVSKCIVGHPATWIFSECCSPKFFQIEISVTVPPGQQTEANQNSAAAGDYEPVQGFAGSTWCRQACGSERDRADAGQVLVMVRHKCEPKSVKHDKAEQRAQRRDKKQCSDFDASAEKAPSVIDHHRKYDRRDQPQVSNRVCGINLPLRIDEGEVRWPKYFAEVKPSSAARNQ